MIRLYCLLISIFLLTFAPECIGQSAMSDSLYSRGMKLFNEGKYNQALSYFKDSYDLDQTEIDSLSPRRNYSSEWLAYCYYKLGKTEEAKKYNKESYKSKPVDRRLTNKIDSLSAEASKDFINRRFFSALQKTDEIDRLESLISEDNSYYHVGTYQMKAKCYGAIQKSDSAFYYLQKAWEIKKQYLEEFDTLSVETLNGLFYLSLNLHQYDEAELYNKELTDVLINNYDENHFLNAETLYQKVILYLHQRKWDEAHQTLPSYINVLKRCFGNNPELFGRAMLTIRGNFEMCGRYDDVRYIDEQNAGTTKKQNLKHYFDSLIMQYASLIESKDSARIEEVEKEITKMLEEYPEDSVKVQRTALSCLKIVWLVAKGDLPEAQNDYLKLQKDSLEQYLDEQSEYYFVYLITKGIICISLSDYEGGISALTKFLGRMNVIEQRQNPNILAQVACLHAMAGHYQKAREMTDKAIRDYKQYVLDNGAAYRLDTDTAKVGQIVGLIQTHINNSAALPDSAVYTLREIKSEYLLLKANLLTNTKRYQISYDYYKCIFDYAFELIKISKYIEAQEVMDKYLSEWQNCYDAINPNSNEENDLFDRLFGQMALESALEFRSIKCYEKGDPAGVKAHRDYIEYVKKEYGEKTETYFDALIQYYIYIDDNSSLLNYLSSAIDERPEDLSPNEYKLIADTYAKENQLELAQKYRKKYIAMSLADSITRVDKQYQILKEVENIINFYVNVEKDTSALFRYYQDELWPSLDICGDYYLNYFVRTIDELCFEVDDASFIPFVNKEMERRQHLFTFPIIQGCVDQVIAGVLSWGYNDKKMAVDYMKQACKKVEKDSVLHLLFSCQLHEVFYRCAPDNIDSTILLGNKLIKIMGEKDVWKYTHEYANLVQRQLDLLQRKQCYDEIASLCQSYLRDFSQKKQNDLTQIFNRKHSMYESLGFLNNVRMESWSLDVAIPSVNNALYTALSIKKPQIAGEYAINLVRDLYNDMESSLNNNYVSTLRCDRLISLTSKLAYKHQTDSLKMYAYDASLLCKGLQLRSNHAIRNIIQKSGHKSALRKYDELQYTLRLLENASDERIDSLQNRIKTLERELFRLSEYFGDYTKALYYSWKDVQNSLTDEDIAIEFTFVEKEYDDIYVRYDSTFCEGYYACILKKGMSMPDIVFICETDSIDTDPSTYYHTDMTRKIMLPLEQHLKGVSNIYFSPIGALNLLSIEALPQLNDSSKTLSQMYNIYRLSSTRELLDNNFRFEGKNAVVYGGLAYDATIDILETDSKNYIENKTRDIKIDEIDIQGIRSVIADIPYLAGTKIEADNVAFTINSAKDTLLFAQTFEGVEGTEASFKSLDGKQKRIIHLATHGYYFNETETEKLQSIIGTNINNREKEEQSLMRSGLFMTGAENKYQGEPIPEGIEDGILTAQEIANTDLTGLDLCVLSACQTAQGEISSEGVFGLQRGFKKAGANSILMSLWKVDDEATCLLMTEFYKYWIVDGKSKLDALELAKQSVRSHKEEGWDDPRYWAAFILLDALD